MPLMSSRMTFFYKWIFPIIWFGFLAVFFVVGLVKGSADAPISNLPFLIIPVVMAILGYQIMKKMAFNLVDEVFDLGDALLVQRRPRRTHRTRRHQECELLSLYESAAGHPIAAAAVCVRRDNCVLCAGPAHAAVDKSGDRKADRPH